MRLSELLKDTGADVTSLKTDPEISGVSYDSRSTKEGDLFVCIKGFATDGHQYAAKAAENGASAILAEDPLKIESIPVVYAPDTRHGLAAVSANFFGHPSDDMVVFGVTGTNGKTTITYLLQAILERAGRECGVIGTIPR